ncbi:uncharacterized protein DUF3108 [Albidovulum inexpectatum]|uniref:Uncharacterized protein DUF3108 n=1 Tax=Albidovulum inexpectatum TaxID=196587 RepID=A0A2S5JH75_9RHOB|nr:DUF3108 domain-containing protein [Albidovulum inexpectatum]PPB80645.1 uncharacterized protein DUF3108 [Albidovulum inexpectatum]
MFPAMNGARPVARPAIAGRTRALVAAIAMALGGPATGQETFSAVFDLTLRGIHAGTLSVSGAIEGQSYAAAGVLKSGGLVALVRKVRYDARVQGTYRDGRFVPRQYVEDADTGKRKSRAVMDYVNGVPQLKKYDPPRKSRSGDIDPATQGGTVDPLTALFAALRDVPRAEACDLSLTLFDGKRRSQVRIGTPVTDGNGLRCNGEYRRLAGFSEKEMAEKTRFPFTMRLQPGPDGRMKVVEVSMDTIYGKGRLERR